MVVEKMPEFVGGEQAMYKYIAGNIQYPDQAKKDGIEGRVYISFIVEKDGRISKVETMRGIGGGCDKEALRVIRNMPNWIPGEQRGEKVRVQYRMPIKFTLSGAKNDKEITDDSDNQLFQVVEKMPEFTGGKQAMYKYISNNIKYPKQAKTENIQGKVFIEFIIEKDGKISNVKVKRGIGGGCDEEALRVIRNMPSWIPGKQRGENVRVVYTIPIKFNLN